MKSYPHFLFITFYRLLFLPALLIVFPRYLCTMIRRRGYGACFWHRFGCVPKPTVGHPIWIQAVSVGEVEALKPLLSALQQKNIPVYLTTTTSTAFGVARTKYASWVDRLAYFPLDFWLFSALAWRRIQPKQVVLMESELWPEHLAQAARHKVPVYLINGRCSDRSFKRYRQFPWIASLMLNQLSIIAAATDCDTQRFRSLCPHHPNITTVGNLKVDASLLSQGETLTLQRADLGSSWESASIIIGASTWPGEEGLLLDCFMQLKKQYPNLKLILVPRHKERKPELQRLLKTYPLSFCFRSQLQQDVSVYVVDSTGELRDFIALADWVFIGKSLDPNRGGQTPLEAAALGKPMIYGPHMENFADICSSLEQAGGACRCQTAEEIQSCLTQWVNQPQSAITYGNRAHQWILAHKGTVQRLLTLIFDLPSHP